MIYGYARVSTADQDLEAQVNELKDAGCEKIVEEKQSGKNLKDRPKLQGLLDFVSDGDKIVFTKLDRFARSARDAETISEELKEKGVEIVVLDMKIDTSTAPGKLMFTIISAFAEFERSLIAERTGEGRARAMSKGVKFGPKPKFTAEQRAAAVQAYKQSRKQSPTKSAETIAKEHGMSRPMLYKLVRQADELHG